MVPIALFHDLPYCLSVLAGVTVKDTWDTKNVITAEVAFEGKAALKGNKLTLVKTHNASSSWYCP